MGRLVKGDIIVIDFPYSNLTKYKRRPALIIKVPKGSDVLACQITATSFADKVEIPINQEDFNKASLNKRSFIRLDKIFSVEKSMIKYKVGSLKEKKFNEIIDKICLYLKK